MSLHLQASDPLPGVRVQDSVQWAAIQQQMQGGVSLTPLLPIGDDAGVVWIPKNGCSTIKRAWLQLQGCSEASHLVEPHAASLPHTHWLNRDELHAVAPHRSLMAIWRDPIDRFVSACRSHLRELTSSAIDAKLRNHSNGDEELYQQTVEFHDELFASHGLASFSAEGDPVEVMNAVALQLPQWIQCHIDWSHHTLPQVAYLGGDPSVYHSLLGMEQITPLMQRWQQVSGVVLDATPQHVSSELTNDDSWRCLQRDQLSPAALDALQQFYAADWAFLELAQQRLGPMQTEEPARQAA